MGNCSSRLYCNTSKLTRCDLSSFSCCQMWNNSWAWKQSDFSRKQQFFKQGSAAHSNFDLRQELGWASHQTGDRCSLSMPLPCQRKRKGISVRETYWLENQNSFNEHSHNKPKYIQIYKKAMSNSASLKAVSCCHHWCCGRHWAVPRLDNENWIQELSSESGLGNSRIKIKGRTDGDLLRHQPLKKTAWPCDPSALYQISLSGQFSVTSPICSSLQVWPFTFCTSSVVHKI